MVSSSGSLGGGVTRRLHCGDGPVASPFGSGDGLGSSSSRGCLDFVTGFGLLRGGNLARVTRSTVRTLSSIASVQVPHDLSHRHSTLLAESSLGIEGETGFN